MSPMKFLSRKTFRLLILAGVVIILVLVSALSASGQTGQPEATPQPSLTPTPTLSNGEIALISGDTEGMMLGAAAILVIILAGVFIQRYLLKASPGGEKIAQP